MDNSFFVTSSYQENGVFDVCCSTAHLLHPFSQLESLRKTSQWFKLKRQKDKSFILSGELARTYMFIDGDIDHTIFNFDLYQNIRKVCNS